MEGNGLEEGHVRPSLRVRQLLFASPAEFDVLRQHAAGLRADLVNRLPGMVFAALVIAWIGQPMIAVAWFMLAALNETLEYFVAERMFNDPNAEDFWFQTYLWNMGFGGTVWALAALSLWLTNSFAGMLLGFALIIGALVHTAFHYTLYSRALVIVSLPMYVVFLIMPATLLGSSADLKSAIIFVLAFALLLYYLASATLSNLRMHRDLRNAVAESERLASVKSEFLANMSHEIRTPMNGVLGMAQLLQQTPLDEKQSMYADSIYESGAALLTVINDVLDFSKIEAGKMELDPAPLDLHGLAEDVVLLLGASAREKGLEVLVQSSPDLPNPLVGDAARLRQILMNLVGNAIKFTHEGYVHVLIDGRVDNDAFDLALCVKDTGIGIPADKVDTIFQQFAQAEGSTTRHYGGTGLGLAISQSIVRAMGGNIRVQSEYGRGSNFEVRLTLPIGTAPMDTYKKDVHLEDNRILIVDDLDLNRRILDEVLTKLGAEVTHARSAAEGLALMRARTSTESPYDLVITDYQMPETDGLDFVKSIREDTQLESARIIVLSSVDRGTVAKEFKGLGVSAYLLKPVRHSQLVQEIGRSLAESGTAVGTDCAHTRSDKDLSTDTPSDSPTQARSRILVADDNEANRLIIQHMMDMDRFDVTFAVDGREAFDLFRSASYDLVLMDISMPDMDGIEATKAIRSHEASVGQPGTPVIALTAHAMPGDRDRFLDAGMDDHLTKPIQLAELNRILSKWSGARSNDQRAA